MDKISNIDPVKCHCGGDAALTTIFIMTGSDLMCNYMQCGQCGKTGDSSPNPREAALYWNYQIEREGSNDRRPEHK